MNAETRLEKRLGFQVHVLGERDVHITYSDKSLEDVPDYSGELSRMWNELLRLERENEWIPVSERLPEFEKEVMFFGEGTRYFGRRVITHPSGDWAWFISGGGCRPEKLVSHWRELPQPPEREK